MILQRLVDHLWNYHEICFESVKVDPDENRKYADSEDESIKEDEEEEENVTPFNLPPSRKSHSDRSSYESRK